LTGDYQSCRKGLELPEEANGIGDVCHLAGARLAERTDSSHLNGWITLKFGSDEPC
jgi:hypothetical protein